jgi:hypothetical protein
VRRPCESGEIIPARLCTDVYRRVFATKFAYVSIWPCRRVALVAWPGPDAWSSWKLNLASGRLVAQGIPFSNKRPQPGRAGAMQITTRSGRPMVILVRHHRAFISPSFVVSFASGGSVMMVGRVIRGVVVHHPVIRVGTVSIRVPVSASCVPFHGIRIRPDVGAPCSAGLATK